MGEANRRKKDGTYPKFEQKSFEDAVNNNKLLVLGAYWQSPKSKDRYLEVVFTPDRGDLDGIWTSLQKSINDNWAKWTAVPHSDYIKQLEDIISRSISAGGYTFKDQTLALMNVYYLEKIGVIKSDNFNGMHVLRGSNNIDDLLKQV